LRRRSFKPNEHDIASEGLPSASTFNEDFRCPGKRALCAKLPKQADTPASELGKRIHHAMAEGDFSILPNETERKLASRIAYGEAEIVHHFGFEGALVEFEQRFWDTEGLEHSWSAQVDRHDWMPKEKRLLVIDDKTGWTIPPPVTTNWQVKSEGGLLADHYEAEEIVVALIHPYHPDSLWQAHVYNRVDCELLLDTVRHHVKAIQMPNQPRIAGGIQCAWCTAQRVCPEFIAHEAALDKAIDDEVQDLGFTAINARSREERGEHVRQLKQRVKNIEVLLQQYTELLERSDNSITGWRLSRKLTRKVNNEGEAIRLVNAAYGPDMVAECLKFNLIALEHQLYKRGTQREAREAVERVLKSVLVFERGKYFLTEARST